MKIIHVADVHLGSSLTTHLDKTKTRARKNELLATFSSVFDYAEDNKVDIILIAGDLFDSNVVSKDTKTFITNLIRKHEKIEVIYLPGNHDEESFMQELESSCANLKIFGSTWSSFHYEDVAISGIINNKSTQKYMYNTLKLNPNDINIVTLHGQIGEYNEEDLKLSKFKDKDIDYIALGHIHSYSKEKLDERCTYSYSGCLEGRGFDEDGQKGFVLLEIDNHTLTSKFIPFAKRTLHKVDIDITNLSSWLEVTNEVNEALTNISSEDMVEVILRGKYDLNFVKQVEVFNEILNRKYYFAKIKDISSLNVVTSDYEHEISLKGEFIRLVSSLDFDEEEKNQVIELGIKALNGEEL